MKKTVTILLSLFFFYNQNCIGQDTFSIVAVDSATGEVGSAGASCVDLFAISGYPTDFLSELFPGVGGINSQASYDPTNQTNARNRMNAGDTPSQIISWLVANDVAANPTDRQYGIVRLVAGSPQVAAYTGANCMDYKNHIVGKTYSIQGNILLGQKVLDSMESRFKAAKGDLACKLMAALQGANMVGADSRCASNGTSSLFAFVKVAQRGDAFGSPSFLLSVKTKSTDRIEPIDSLQKLFNAARSCTGSGITTTSFNSDKVNIAPNPFNTQTIVTFSEARKNVTIKIVDMLGKQVKQINFTGKELIIEKEEMVEGMYFLQIIDNNNTVINKKILVQ